MRERRSAIRAGLGAALAVALGLASQASAVQYQMDGTWEMRRGQVFIPLQFGKLGSPRPTSGYGFPNGPIQEIPAAVVAAAGTSNGTITVPQYVFAGKFAAAVPLAGVTLVQITTNFSAMGPETDAVLAPGYGTPFTWCPGDIACGPGGPPQGAGTRNGRIIYTAAGAKFGGVIQMLLNGGGVNTFLFNASPFQAGHVFFGGVGNQLSGGPYSFMDTNYLAGGFVTQPLAVPTPNALITQPGGKLTTGGGITTMGATGPIFMLSAQTTSNTGFPATTGTVFAQQTTGTGGADLFTVTGSDNRTALGAGNITLVSGGISQRNTLAGQTSYAVFGRITMALQPKGVPSVGPSGLATGAVLMLLAVGFALRRRF
jgi:hypothetical protein